MNLEGYSIYNRYNKTIQPSFSFASGNNRCHVIHRTNSTVCDSISFGMKDQNIMLYVQQAKKLVPELKLNEKKFDKKHRYKNITMLLKEAISGKKQDIDEALEVFNTDETYGKLKQTIIKMMLGMEESYKGFYVPSEIFTELKKKPENESLSQVSFNKLCKNAVDTFCNKIGANSDDIGANCNEIGAKKVQRKTKIVESKLNILSLIFKKNFDEIVNENGLEELMNTKNPDGKSMKDIINGALLEFDTTNEEMRKEKTVIEGLLNLNGSGYKTIDDLHEELNIGKSQVGRVKKDGINRIIGILAKNCNVKD